MLSKREIKRLREAAAKYEYPMVESDILNELLDFYEGKEAPKKKQKTQQVIIHEAKRVD